jgi:hypothetical protein
LEPRVGGLLARLEDVVGLLLLLSVEAVELRGPLDLGRPPGLEL